MLDQYHEQKCDHYFLPPVKNPSCNSLVHVYNYLLVSFYTYLYCDALNVTCSNMDISVRHIQTCHMSLSHRQKQQKCPVRSGIDSFADVYLWASAG